MIAAVPLSPETLDARVGVALVGCGNWGEKLARTFGRMPGAALRAVCDLAPGARARASELAPTARVEERFEALLERADTRAVVIATPPASHAELALSALRAGHDVLVEKPMALSLADALVLEDAAAKAGRVLMVGHILEYHPAVVELRRRIAAGELGCVQLVISERMGPSTRRHEDAWWSLGPHDLSMMRLLSAHEPTAVSVRGWASDHPKRADVVVARVDGNSGVLGVAHLSTVAPKKVRRVSVIGSEGVALFDDLVRGRELCFFERRTLGSARLDDVVAAARQLRPAERSSTDVLDGIASDRWLPASGGRVLPLAAGEPLMIEAEHFISGVLGRGAIQSDAASGRRVVAALEAGAASLVEGGSTRPVALGREPR